MKIGKQTELSASKMKIGGRANTCDVGTEK